MCIRCVFLSCSQRQCRLNADEYAQPTVLSRFCFCCDKSVSFYEYMFACCLESCLTTVTVCSKSKTKFDLNRIESVRPFVSFPVECAFTQGEWDTQLASSPYTRKISLSPSLRPSLSLSHTHSLSLSFNLSLSLPKLWVWVVVCGVV